MSNMTATVSKFNSLSNAVFGFALVIIVPEIMEGFRRWAFLAPEGHNFDLSENLTEIVRYATIFDELSNVFFSTTNRSRDRQGCPPPPPPGRWWKIWSASGARVNFDMTCNVVSILKITFLALFGEFMCRNTVPGVWRLKLEKRPSCFGDLRLRGVGPPSSGRLTSKTR